MWFKMSMDILNCAAMREIETPQVAHDCRHGDRKLIFIYLLSLTASGYANDIQDSADLARLVGTTPKQAQIVWDVCIKHGVLRKGEHGYSARPWMIERGILGDMRKWRKDEGKSLQHQPQESKNSFL